MEVVLWMPMVLVKTKNYLSSLACTTIFFLLNSQEQSIGPSQVSVVCWNGTRFGYSKQKSTLLGIKRQHLWLRAHMNKSQ